MLDDSRLGDVSAAIVSPLNLQTVLSVNMDLFTFFAFYLYFKRAVLYSHLRFIA